MTEHEHGMQFKFSYCFASDLSVALLDTDLEDTSGVQEAIRTRQRNPVAFAAPLTPRAVSLTVLCISQFKTPSRKSLTIAQKHISDKALGSMYTSL